MPRAQTQSILSRKHKVHQYVRFETPKGRVLYRCTLAGCRHFIWEEFIVGQISLCTRCDQEFVIGRNMIAPKPVGKPHCEKCTRPTFSRRTGKVQLHKTVEIGGTTLTDDDIMQRLKDILK